MRPDAKVGACFPGQWCPKIPSMRHPSTHNNLLNRKERSKIMRIYAYKKLNETNIVKVFGKIFTAYPNTTITRAALLPMTLTRFEARMVMDNGYWTSSETVGK